MTPKENDLDELLVLVFFFSNLGEVKELKSHKSSALMLVGQSVVEEI
jgi:hypothetical protein